MGQKEQNNKNTFSENDDISYKKHYTSIVNYYANYKYFYKISIHLKMPTL
jgi:hypothetical protein